MNSKRNGKSIFVRRLGRGVDSDDIAGFKAALAKSLNPARWIESMITKIEEHCERLKGHRRLAANRRSIRESLAEFRAARASGLTDLAICHAMRVVIASKDLETDAALGPSILAIGAQRKQAAQNATQLAASNVSRRLKADEAIRSGFKKWAAGPGARVPAGSSLHERVCVYARVKKLPRRAISRLKILAANNDL